MDSVTRAQIELAEANERLRQERDTFNARLEEERRMRPIRVAMGWVTVVAYPAIAAAAGYVVFNNQDFNDATVLTSTSALLVESLGLAITSYRAVLGTAAKRTLAPVTSRPALGRSQKQLDSSPPPPS